VSSALGNEGGELFLGSKKLVSLVRTLHNLFEGAGLNDRYGRCRWGQSRGSSNLGQSTYFATGARISCSANDESFLISQLSSGNDGRRDFDDSCGNKRLVLKIIKGSEEM